MVFASTQMVHSDVNVLLDTIWIILESNVLTLTSALLGIPVEMELAQMSLVDLNVLATRALNQAR